MVDAIVELPSSLLLGFGLIINYLPPGALPLCLFFFLSAIWWPFWVGAPFSLGVSGCLVFD